MGLIAELKRRNVFRVGMAYLVLGWVVIQVTDIVSPALNLPDWTLPMVTWFGVIGFPFALLFAWAFELTPDGIKREHEVDRTQSIAHHTGRKVDFAIIGLLVVAMAFIVWDAYLSGRNSEVSAAEAGGPAVEAARIEPVQTTPASIAVLPFTDMSAGKDQEYFSDGIAEELLNALAKLKNLRVAARTSSFAFKGQQQNITEIGNKLKVDTVLEGSVRKAGTRLRITAQLIDVENGYHLWSETYDRELTDVFAVQDELTAAIVAALKVHLDVGEETGSSNATDNWEAYDAYLKGLHAIRKRTKESIAAAIEHFEKAVQLEPGFAAAIAQQAQATLLLAAYNGISKAEAREKGEVLLALALSINPDLAEAHATTGFMLFRNGQCGQALPSFERAIALNPGLVEPRHWRALCLLNLGRLRESLEAEQRAYQLDPMHAAVFAAMSHLKLYYGMELELDLEAAQKFFPNQYYTHRINKLHSQKRWAEAYKISGDYPDKDDSTTNEHFFSLMLIQKNSALLEKILNSDTFSGHDYYLSTQLIFGQLEEVERYLKDLGQDQLQWRTRDEIIGFVQYRTGHWDRAEATISRIVNTRKDPYTIDASDVLSSQNLAVSMADLLQSTDRSPAAREYISLARAQIDFLKRSGARAGYHLPEARLQILEGNYPEALKSLGKAFDAGNFWWVSFDDPIIRRLATDPGMIAFKGRVENHINAERATLGWSPAEF